jgi:diguanylate cyclase (GGDEF)-like protein
MARLAFRDRSVPARLAAYVAITLLLVLGLGVVLGAGFSAGSAHVRAGIIVGLVALILLVLGPTLAVYRGLGRELGANAFRATHDALTKLPNRGLFRDRATAAIGRSPSANRWTTIAIVDLDRFKQINDALGDDGGDRLLTELAERLKGEMRVGDSVARVGGHEFGLVLRNLADAEQALQRLREVIRRDVALDGLTLAIDSSIGFVTVFAGDRDVDQHLRHAELAMNAAKAKHAGVVAYSPFLEPYDIDELTLVAELPDAITGDQLVLQYQPQLDPATGKTTSVEALLRWAHPTRGLLAPGQFLPLAEQTEVIEPITDWVIATALRDVRRAGQHGFDICVSVNVSARSIVRDDFAARVLQALADAAVLPKRLKVEVTEAALMTGGERATQTLITLASAGVGVSLDDFGRGRTSLGDLASLPVGELKIDRSFVTDMISHKAHAAIVRSMIDLGHNLGLRVVAEGIESGDVLTALREAGCDHAQGFRIARPMPLEQLIAWLAARPHASLPSSPKRRNWRQRKAAKLANPIWQHSANERAARFVRDWGNRDLRVSSGR